MGVKVGVANLWTLEWAWLVGVRVGVAVWALEWAWHPAETVGVRVGVAHSRWALEWAWHTAHQNCGHDSFRRFVEVRVGVAHC